MNVAVQKKYFPRTVKNFVNVKEIERTVQGKLSGLARA